MSQVNATIKIDGWDEELAIQTLNLQQAYNQHHVFEVAAAIPEGYGLTVEKIRKALGEQVHLTISSREKGGAACQFHGFVDQIIPSWSKRGRAIQARGFSPTVFWDSAPQFRTFSEKTTVQIIDAITGKYRGKHCPPMVKNGAGEKVDFSIQAQETDYRYLCRLADTYGKLFFYDGTQLYFGNLAGINSSELHLDFKKDLNGVELSLNLAPLSFSLSGYDLEQSQQVPYSCSNACQNNHSLVAAALEKSGVYPPSKIQITHLVQGKGELEMLSEKMIARQAHELIILKGNSSNPGLKPGSRICIKNTKEMVTEGAYIVIEVNHVLSGDRSYRNSFTAVPAGFPFPVRMQAARHPVCGPLMAIVKENSDPKNPKNLGRVRVEFIGDEMKSLSPWMRVLVPYTKHGGMYFLPEINDQVVVFFEDFNAERSPFVLGSFFHGKATAEKWRDKDNMKKGIATAKIEFLFDDRTGKLTIQADEIELKARKKMNFDGGDQLVQSAGRIELNP